MFVTLYEAQKKDFIVHNNLTDNDNIFRLNNFIRIWASSSYLCVSF
jgi:hypothetical protein